MIRKMLNSGFFVKLLRRKAFAIGFSIVFLQLTVDGVSLPAMVELPGDIRESQDIYLSRSTPNGSVLFFTLKKDGIFLESPLSAEVDFKNSTMMITWSGNDTPKTHFIQIDPDGNAFIFSIRNKTRYKIKFKAEDLFKALEEMHRKKVK